MTLFEMLIKGYESSLAISMIFISNSNSVFTLIIDRLLSDGRRRRWGACFMVDFNGNRNWIWSWRRLDLSIGFRSTCVQVDLVLIGIFDGSIHFILNISSLLVNYTVLYVIMMPKLTRIIWNCSVMWVGQFSASVMSRMLLVGLCDYVGQRFSNTDARIAL